MKANRQEKIIELVSKYEIETQEDLARFLLDAGYKVTQATISRDINELRLEKIPTKNGVRYYYPENKVADAEKYLRVFKDGYAGLSQAGNIVVVKTISGMAMAVAAALDHLKLPEIVGSIAGDDTIMCATKSNNDAMIAIDKIQRLLKTI